MKHQPILQSAPQVLLTTVLFMTALVASAPAALADDPATTLRVERVALFKNGLGFFSSRTTLPKNVTTVELGDLPVPAHGTFWVDHDKDTLVRGVFTRLEQVAQNEPVESIVALLEANVGRSVSLEPGPIVGELVSASSELVLVRSKAGTIAVHPDSLEAAMFAGENIRNTREVETTKSAVRLELAKPAGGASVGVSYLAKGISWAPSYLIDLSDPQLARFSAKAVVVNEAVDLENVEFQLVTGFPNLLFANVASPMASNQTLDTFFRALRQGDNDVDHNIMVQQALSNARSSQTQSGPAYSAQTEGQAAEDLFLYPVPRITLRRGEKAWLPLFKAEMPYEHVYTWEIPDFQDREEHRYSGQPRESQEQEVVWHSCRLTNTSNIPLTTAPAQFIKGGQIVGQDQVYYTGSGATTTIRINHALGLVAEQAEHETSRERQAVKLYGRSYDKVRIQGKLELSNTLGKAAQVEVTKSISGELGDTSDDPELTSTTKGLRAVNPSLRLLWKLDLEAGEEKLISYEYTVLVRP